MATKDGYIINCRHGLIEYKEVSSKKYESLINYKYFDIGITKELTNG